jgi:hypothetical protein
MKPFSHNQWHVWSANNPFKPQILVSDEDNKKLYSFKTTDDAINWLYIEGFKETARALNSHIKAAK